MASEIVVGIDFGTTYSGVSWAVNGGNKVVRVINDWPNPASDLETSDKVPTKISYENGKPARWGYSVELKEDCFRWFKLLLDPKNKIGQSSEAVTTSLKLLRSLNKRAEDVAADYLRLLWQYTKADIAKARGVDWESNYTVKVVLTVPAIWSHEAKDRTMKIATNADLPGKIDLVSEPEAAALAVLKEKNKDGETLKVGDCFVVCDAGGGTVDLISYKICKVSPLEIKEVAVGDGDLCGSVYLDQAFERYIRTLVGDEQWARIRDKYKKKMMNKFEMGIKRAFAGDNQKYSVDLEGVEDNPSEGIDDDTITLKASALRTIFDHVICQIMRLVDKQIDQVQSKGNAVKAILLVGGFGKNRYMYSQLHEAHSRSGIQVLADQVTAWSSICRGATLWGLEHLHSENSPTPKKTVVGRIARFSYGVSYAVRFNEAMGHRIEDRQMYPDGEFRAVNQMGWLLEKGEEVEDGRVIHQPLAANVQVGTLSTGMRAFSDILYYCADDEPPSRKDFTVKQLCRVDYGISCSDLKSYSSYRDPRTRQKYRDAQFDLFIILDSATLHFAVLHKGNPVAYTEAKYKEGFE